MKGSENGWNFSQAMQNSLVFSEGSFNLSLLQETTETLVILLKSVQKISNILARIEGVKIVIMPRPFRPQLIITELSLIRSR